jgi:hypothetical protein
MFPLKRTVPDASGKVAVLSELVAAVARIVPKLMMLGRTDGEIKLGEVLKTSNPVPVSSVTAAARFAELGVARKVATPVPKSELLTSVTAVPVPFLKEGTPLPLEYQAERPAISVGTVPFSVTKCPAAPVPGILAKWPVFVASPATFAVPLKLMLKMLRGVASAVAVPAFPLTLV